MNLNFRLSPNGSKGNQTHKIVKTFNLKLELSSDPKVCNLVNFFLENSFPQTSSPISQFFSTGKLWLTSCELHASKFWEFNWHACLLFIERSDFCFWIYGEHAKVANDDSLLLQKLFSVILFALQSLEITFSVYSKSQSNGLMPLLNAVTAFLAMWFRMISYDFVQRAVDEKQIQNLNGWPGKLEDECKIVKSKKLQTFSNFRLSLILLE